MSAPGRDEPPNTWAHHPNAFQSGPDRWAGWANICGTETGTRLPDGTWDRGAAMTADTAPGLMEWHWDEATNHWCGGYVGFRNRGDSAGKHELVSADPLTITPSLLCNRCHDHGWIRDGRWVPA